jgi:tetratricopeptide (TPR) repeat protein
MRRCLAALSLFLVIAAVAGVAQLSPSDQLQVGPPPLRRADPPSSSSTAEELEKRADELRAQKAYLDAIDYYQAAMSRQPPDMAALYNKIGITNLLVQRYKDARKNFEKSIKTDKKYADAYNNLGVIYYLEKKNGKAIKQYQKAIAIRQDFGSYFSNLGAAYFAEKQFDQATQAYTQALQIDPDIFERTSHNGVAAQMSSPADRARFDYVLARLFAKSGNTDRSLQYLRKAMEEGYKGIDDVYKDSEFTELRKDPRFNELMTSRPPAIPE